MKFFNLLIVCYSGYYLINILLDLAKSKRNTPSSTKPQPVEFAISTPAPPQSVYADATEVIAHSSASSYMPPPVVGIKKSNSTVNTDKPVINDYLTHAENPKAVFTEKDDVNSASIEPEVNIISALDLEIISDGIEITEEQLGLYAIAQ